LVSESQRCRAQFPLVQPQRACHHRLKPFYSRCQTADLLRRRFVAYQFLVVLLVVSARRASLVATVDWRVGGTRSRSPQDRLDVRAALHRQDTGAGSRPTAVGSPDNAAVDLSRSPDAGFVVAA